MKPPHPPSAATTIVRSLLSAAKSTPTTTLNQTLHRLLRHETLTLTPTLISSIVDPHLLHHPSLSLSLFNWATQQPNFTPSAIAYHSLFKSLALSRHYNTLEKLLREANARKIPVEHSYFRQVIGYQVKSRRTHQAYLLLNDVGLSVGDIGEGLCNAILAGLVSEGLFQSARQLFDEMLERRVRLNTIGFGLYMWRYYCRTSQLDQILHILDMVRQRESGFDGSIVALLIVHGLCETGRVSDAYNALEELRNRGCKPDFMAYRVIAEGYRSKGPGCVFEVQMVLKKKRKLGVAPRASDYREFVLALISENLLWEAKELGRVIVDGNFPIEDDVLNALVGSVSLVDPSSAMSFFDFMVAKGRTISLPTLKNLSRNLIKHGEIEHLLNVFTTLSSMDNYFTSLESYNIMVSSLCEAGRVREAYSALQEMRKKGLNPDVSFYNVLMEALCNEDLIRPAKKLWDEMFACGVEGDLKTYNTLIKKFVEVGQMDEALQLFQNILQKNVTPDEGIYMSLLEGLCKDSKVQGAIQVFYKAADQDAKMAQSLLHPLVLFLCEGGHFVAASKFLCSNCYLKHPESHATLLRFLAESKDLTTSIAHLKQVMAVSPALLQEISTEILALLASSSNPDPMLILVQEMQKDESSSSNSIWRDFCEQLLSWVTHSLHPPNTGYCIEHPRV